MSFWPIYGQINYMDLYKEFDKCDKDCPTKDGIVYGYILTMIYMIAGNTLLINLLIAMFR